MEFLNTLQNALEPYPWAYSAVIALALVAAAVLVNIIIKFVLYRILQRLLHILPPKGSEEYKVCLAIVSRLANIVPAIVLGAGAAAIPGIHEVPATLIRNISAAFIILVFTLALGNILDLVDIIYHRRSESANRPIKGYLQLLKICFWAVALILTVATLINKSPLMLLSGLGAMAAVLILIFQDTILSVVAALQIRSNDMIRIGDWIEMPTQNTDGYVIEIALHTIKVQNWDKTISTLPVRKLITDSFKNWRGMFEAGGRRIKRSLYIDQRSVRFLTEDEIAKLEDFVLINDYLEHKKQELAEWNANLAAQGAKPINGRRITNLGTFRAYVEQYLRHHSGINQELMLLVRQLPPAPTGIPLEIYCFTSAVNWIPHEKTQSDIFDHLLAILPIFGLRVFQQCSDVSGMIPARFDAAQNGTNS